MGASNSPVFVRELGNVQTKGMRKTMQTRSRGVHQMYRSERGGLGEVVLTDVRFGSEADIVTASVRRLLQPRKQTFRNIAVNDETTLHVRSVLSFPVLGDCPDIGDICFGFSLQVALGVT